MNEYQRIVAAYEPVVQQRVRRAYWRGIGVGVLVGIALMAAGLTAGILLAMR